MVPGESDIGGKFNAESKTTIMTKNIHLGKRKRRESSDPIYLKNPMEFRCPESGSDF